jgi:class 3 adenylate cyclase/tetratricopeptide (TPR) repeat protein
VNCHSCGQTNPEGARFCNECGAPALAGCATCGNENPPGAKFCNGCGAALGGAAPATQAPAAETRSPADYTPQHLADKILQSKSALEGERKRVTVMFADVKGSMELAEQVGAEQWHVILDRFFAILTEGVHRFEGSVNQYTGDGIMALFGAPISHEDHAQRACYAALHLKTALRDYADELRRTEGVSLSARIGLNSGEVVVGKIGDDLRMDYTAQGHTVGLAQRMEARAAADSTYLTENTARLVEGYFALRDLGEFDLKGSSEPMRVYELDGLGEARTRLDRARARGFAKFVGRDREFGSLDDALESAIAGNGQVVGVVAEAGTGKSRLCAEFVASCRARGIRVNEGHCPAHGKTVPYLPLLEILRDIFEVEDRDSDHEVRRKITGELMLLDDEFQKILPLLFEFLGVPDPDRPAPPMSPEGRQQQLFGFVRHLQQVRSEREPTVILLDDLHWIDPASDEFLAHAVEATQGHRTLMLVNFRPEYHANWMTKSYYQQIALQPLGREAIGLLLDDLVGSDPSVESLPDRVYARTGGNPFFVEEVVQSLIENGSLEGSRGAYRLSSSVETLEIPANVQSVLAARIDRLPEREKQLLQTASVIQKDFPESILKAVAQLPDSDLAEALAALVQGEFLLQKALYPEAEYAFKHPLTQEVAYRSLLGERRTRLHADVARALEEANVDRLDERAALLAYHWENAGEPLTAASWHARAANHAGADSAADAMRHWNSVWEILASEPETEASTALRSDAAQAQLQMGLRQGLTFEHCEQVFVEGRRLAEATGDTRALLSLLINFGKSAHMMAGTPRQSIPYFEEAIEVAERAGDRDGSWASLEALATTQTYLGKFETSLGLTEQALAASGDDPMVGVSVASFGSAWAHTNRGWNFTELGQYERAFESLRKGGEGLRRVAVNEPVSWTDAFLARSLARAGDTQGALAAGARSVSLAEDLGSFLALVNAYAHHGMALLGAGEFAAAEERLEASLDIARANRVWITLESEFMAILADAKLGLGDGAGARQTIDSAVQIAQRTETPGFELHARLVRARVLRAVDGAAAKSEIEAELSQAEQLVRSIGARSYEPEILEERGLLAAALGQNERAARLRADAVELYRELGADGHAERLTGPASNGGSGHSLEQGRRPSGDPD